MRPRSLQFSLPRLVPFILCASALVSARPAHAQRLRCAADEPLHLSILFDNSGSVYHNLNIGAPQLSNWFRQLAGEVIFLVVLITYVWSADVAFVHQVLFSGILVLGGVAGWL